MLSPRSPGPQLPYLICSLANWVPHYHVYKVLGTHREKFPGRASPCWQRGRLLLACWEALSLEEQSPFLHGHAHRWWNQPTRAMQAKGKSVSPWRGGGGGAPLRWRNRSHSPSAKGDPWVWEVIGQRFWLSQWRGCWSEVKVAQSCPIPCDPMDYSPWDSPGQNTGVGNLSLLQGIIPTQGSNKGLLHCRQIHYQLSWSRWPTSSPMDLPKTGIQPGSLALAGKFFTSWATRNP